MNPGEHKTVQARILAYLDAIGWTFVSREEAGKRSGKRSGHPSFGTHIDRDRTGQASPVS